MNWLVTTPVDQRARRLADRHYSRQKPGTREFSPPGRKLVLINEDATATWVTSWPDAQYVHRIYPDAWICTLFRNESPVLSSDLIREAIAITRWKYGKAPASGMITMIDASKVRSANPGYCYKQAGFKLVGKTQGGLLILQLLEAGMPEAEPPKNALWQEVPA